MRMDDETEKDLKKCDCMYNKWHSQRLENKPPLQYENIGAQNVSKIGKLNLSVQQDIYSIVSTNVLNGNTMTHLNSAVMISTTF